MKEKYEKNLCEKTLVEEALLTFYILHFVLYFCEVPLCLTTLKIIFSQYFIEKIFYDLF